MPVALNGMLPPAGRPSPKGIGTRPRSCQQTPAYGSFPAIAFRPAWLFAGQSATGKAPRARAHSVSGKGKGAHDTENMPLPVGSGPSTPAPAHPISPPEPPASEGGQVQVLRFFCPVSDWTAKSPASRQPPFGTWQAEMSRYKQHSPPAAQKNAPSSPCAELLAPKPRPGPLTGPVAPGTSVPVCTPCEPCSARFPA